MSQLKHMTEAHGQVRQSSVCSVIPLISHALSQIWSFIQWNANQPQSLLLKEQAQLIECGLSQDRPFNDPIKLSPKPYEHVVTRGKLTN